MKKFTHKGKLDIACAALRVGRWVIIHKGEKYIKGYGNGNYFRGYHFGKYFAYMYVLQQCGLAEIFLTKEIGDVDKFLKKNAKGKIALFKGLLGFQIVMDKKFFEEVCKFPDPNWGPDIINWIREKSPEVK